MTDRGDYFVLTVIIGLVCASPLVAFVVGLATGRERHRDKESKKEWTRAQAERERNDNHHP